MKCDFCDNDASIEIVVFVNGKAQKVHLCLDCYREKLSELMQNMPKTMDSGQMAEQIREMLEDAGKSGGISGLEFSFLSNMPQEPHEENEEEESTEESETSDAAFASLTDSLAELLHIMPTNSIKEKKTSKESTKSARDLAFDKQRRALKMRRSVLTEKMQIALQEEEYEKCAVYRDELNTIADALLQLNEERKDPYGV